MTWKSPGEVFERVQESGTQFGIEALVNLLNQAVGKTKNEAENWKSMVSQFEENARIANNQEDLDELMGILGDFEEQAEIYGNVLDDPTYEMSAWRANQIYNERRPAILGYENTLTQIGVDKLNTNTDFDTQYQKRFFDENGDNLVGKAWDDAYMEWEKDRGGAPITFGADYADYNTFWNHWIKMSQSNINNDLKRKNSPITLIKTNYDKYNNIISDLTAMGVEFEMTPQGWMTGGITNLPKLNASGFKTSFEIPYIDENGNEQTQTMSLPELARIAVEQQGVWANYSEGYSNQTVQVGGTRLVPTEDGQMVIEDIAPTEYGVFSQDEMMKILTIGDKEFEAYVAAQQDKLPTKIQTHQSRLASYNGIISDLTKSIYNMKDAQRENQGMAQFANQLNLNESQKELLAGADLSDLDQTSISSMENLVIQINGLILAEQSALQQTMVDAVSFGAYGVETLPAALRDVLEDSTEEGAKKGPVVHRTLKDIEASVQAKMGDYTSLSELESLFGEDYDNFIRFYLGELSGQDISPITQGELTIYDGTTLIPSPIITEFSEFDASNPNQSIGKMHPNYDLNQLYLKNEYISSAAELFNYSNISQQLIDVADKFNIAGDELFIPGEDRQKTMQRLNKLRLDGKFEDGTLVPSIVAANTAPQGISVINLNTGNKENINVLEGNVFKVLSMSKDLNPLSGSIVPSRGVKKGSDPEPDNSFLSRKNLDGQSLISDKMIIEGYASDFNKNLGNEDYPLMWYYESEKPSTFVISDARGNLYLVESSEFIKNNTNIFITDPSLGSVITVGKMPFDIINWKLHNKDFSLKHVGDWSDDMFNFPYKID